jgi:3-methyladenine DNA glycosylase/8-oxoguanine DNA glycosylase
MAKPLSTAPPAALRLLRRDPALRRLMARAQPYTLRPQRRPDLFRELAQCIISQQISGKAAEAIFRRFQGLFPGARPRAELVATMTDATLRGAGLSTGKVLSLRDLARRLAGGELPSLKDLHAMDDPTVHDRLVQVRGIGPWTAQMVLMFTLGRLDVWPTADLGIQKGFQKLYGRRPTPRSLDRWGDRWRPYRSVVAWYLWRALEPIESWGDS